MDKGKITLAHIEFAHVLRVQEVEEIFEKCVKEIVPLYDAVSSQVFPEYLLRI